MEPKGIGQLSEVALRTKRTENKLRRSEIKGNEKGRGRCDQSGRTDLHNDELSGSARSIGT